MIGFGASPLFILLVLALVALPIFLRFKHKSTFFKIILTASILIAIPVLIFLATIFFNKDDEPKFKTGEVVTLQGRLSFVCNRKPNSVGIDLDMEFGTHMYGAFIKLNEKDRKTFRNYTLDSLRKTGEEIDITLKAKRIDDEIMIFDCIELISVKKIKGNTTCTY